MVQKSPSPDLHAFLSDQDGAATPLAIFFCLIALVMGGLSIDYNKSVAERTQLQVAADTAAHSALYTREFESIDDSRTAGYAALEGMLPASAYGDAILPGDIEFGVWDENTAQFTIDNSEREAVRVFGTMTNERGNPSRHLLLNIIGVESFDISVVSTYTTYFPPCFNEGFVANDVVDLQSGNNYTDGFCIHSNEHVSLNQNNYFEPGTVVSMPSLSNLDMPASGFEQNIGLQTALRTGEYRLRILRQLPDIIDSFYNGLPDHAGMAGIVVNALPSYPLIQGNGNQGMIQSDFNDTGKKTLEPASFPQANRIYRSDCTGNGDITFSADTFSDFVLVTNCPIKFSNGTALEGVIIATTDNSDNSVNASHVRIGRDDNCGAGGGAAIYTFGSVTTASALSGYGAQIIALGDIQFTANANGIEGVSFIAGGRIDGTSNSDMGFCDGEGIENFARAPYFRMVQ